MKGIEYPVSLKDIDKFQKQNPTICITVLSYDGKSAYPLRNSNSPDSLYNIIILLIEENCLIKDLSRLLSSQVSKHKKKHNFCLRYLNPFCCQL